MNFDTTDIMDCAHAGQLAGVCQYPDNSGQGCADRLCEQCIATCTVCRRVLCPHHQISVDTADVYCPDHVPSLITWTFIDAAFGW